MFQKRNRNVSVAVSQAEKTNGMASPLKSTNFTQNCRTEHNERKDSCPCAHVLLVMLNFALNAVQIQGNRRINSFHAHSGRMQFVEIVLLTIAVRYPRQMM